MLIDCFHYNYYQTSLWKSFARLGDAGASKKPFISHQKTMEDEACGMGSLGKLRAASWLRAEGVNAKKRAQFSFYGMTISPFCSYWRMFVLWENQGFATRRPEDVE
jgi:hypothetical protein